MAHNIGVFIQTLQLGGAEKQSILLTKALKDKYNTSLIVLNGDLVDKKNLEIVQRNNIRLILLTGNLVSRLLSFYKFLEQEKISVIFSYLASTNFYGSIIGKIAGVKYFIAGIRNSFLPYHKFLIQRFIHNYLAYHTIFNNESGLNQLIAMGFNPNNASVVFNCYDSDNDKIIRYDKKNITVITVARFVKQKNWFAALKSIKILKEKLELENISLKYFVVGYGELENEIRKYITDNNMKSYAEVIINPPDVNVYYIKSDIYLCTSYYEGLSNTILEAMSFYLPVVASNVGDNKVLVNEGENGYLTSVDETNEIAWYLYELAKNDTKRKTFGENSFIRLNRNFSFEKFKENYYSFLDRLDE